MKKINFENLPSTNTPISAGNLNEMQSNIEESAVIVSPTEPTTSEKVWIQKGKNLYNGSLTIGSITDTGVEQVSDNSARSNNYFKVEANKNYIVSYDTSVSGTALNVVTFYDENRTFLSRITGVGKNTFVTPANCKYLRLTFYNSSGISISALSNIQLEQGSTATSYEAYIEPKIHVKNDNGVYEEFYKETKDIIDYSSKIVKNEAYVGNLHLPWCEVRNGIAYVSFNISPTQITMGANAYVILSGLPPAKTKVELQAHLHTDEGPKSIRLYIDTAGNLSWWYNVSMSLLETNKLIINTSYPVA